MFKNNTKNQHFVSQTEQRLNAINPSDKKSKQKIYSFDVLDKKRYKLSSPIEKKIENNLSISCLYNFWVGSDKDKEIYSNFEMFFNKYEKNIRKNTEKLLDKIKENNSDIKEELFNIIYAKTMNSFRNPFCIDRNLKIFGAKKYRPTSHSLLSVFRKIDYSNSDVDRICKKLCIDKKSYRDWLKSIFLLLVVTNNNGKNILENIVDNMLCDPYSKCFVSIYQYTNSNVLLSDKGFVELSNEDCSYFLCNIDRNNFICLSFCDCNDFINNFSQGYLDRKKDFIKYWEKTSTRIDVDVKINNMDILSIYNQCAVSYSFKNCYSSSNEEPYGCHIDK